MTLKTLRQLVTDPSWAFVTISENSKTSEILTIKFIDNKSQEVRKALKEAGYNIFWTNGKLVDMRSQFVIQ